jgi:hypothetical protein
MGFVSHRVRSGMRWLGLAATLPVMLLATVSFVAAVGAAERPTSQTLPDETLAVVRLPNLKGAYDAFKTRTKLGAVLFEQKRIDAVKEYIAEESKSDLDEISAQLVKLGLSFDDILGIFAGEVGYAATAANHEDKPRYVGLLWAECGEKTAEKWLAALDKALENEADGVGKPTREDIELAGVKVRRLRMPLVETTVTEEKGKDEVKKASKVTGHVQLLIGRREGKLLAAHTLVAKVAGEDDDDPKQAEKAEATDREHATAVFARFLEAQGGSGEGFVERKMQTPGLAEALPDGEGIVEALVDIPAVVKLTDTEENAEAMKTVKALALDTLGPLAYRMTLDGTAMRSGLFLSAPSPRNGLVKLIEQTPLPSKADDWVSGDVVGYQHLSLDLGAAYKLITDLVRRHVPKGEESVAGLEEQAKQFLQVDPTTLLASLGSKHTIVSFLPEKKEAGAPAEDETTQNAMAIVWKLGDEALWKRLMGMAALLGAKEVAEERGFNGLRHDKDGFHGGWFIGDGKMILGMGKGVTEKTLAMLRTPPKADASLAGSPIAARAAELIPPQDSITYDLTNGPSIMKFAYQAAIEQVDASPDSKLKKLKPVFPSEKELEGAIGVSVSVTTIGDAGLTHRSVSDLPPP